MHNDVSENRALRTLQRAKLTVCHHMVATCNRASAHVSQSSLHQYVLKSNVLKSNAQQTSSCSHVFYMYFIMH